MIIRSLTLINISRVRGPSTADVAEIKYLKWVPETIKFNKLEEALHYTNHKED